MHKGVKIGIGVVCTGMLSVAGYGVYNVADALMDGRTGQSDAQPQVRTVVTKPPSPQQAEDAANAFLAAWAKGDFQAAAALTDQPESATAALAAFREKVRPSSITLAVTGPDPAVGAPSPRPSAPAGQLSLGFKATLHFAGSEAAWSYDSTLGMVRMSDGKSAVHWTPTVIHPQLTAGRSIAVRPLPASSADSLTDRDGQSLAGYPSLQPLLGELGDRVPAGASGTAGSAVMITDDSGEGSSEKLFTVTEPKAGQKSRLTIDGKLQAAAEQAVRDASADGSRPASLVAVEPSSGKILAFANAPASGQNRAFLGAIAPGSTMKVITAAALLESGVPADSAMPCKQNYSVNGFSFKNDDDESGEDWSFSKDFAQSCNTAFIQQGMTTLTGSQLQDTARKFFNIGPTWKTGLKLSPAKVPAPGSATERAAQLIGQGQITMNSLTMASVAATVQNGTFHQPILIPGYDQIPAERKLSASTLKSLRRMMHLTVTSGTARSAMSGIGGDTGAKTGTAQVGGQSSDNSWFTAYRDDLAVAAEVQGGGHGSEAAGPAAAQVLRVGNQD